MLYRSNWISSKEKGGDSIFSLFGEEGIFGSLFRGAYIMLECGLGKGRTHFGRIVVCCSL